ncbi:hypothetical protein MHBO_005042 [Bonamia ostreae]|uniref:Uncharacterized protein n=1 Tax=Bonamia ostreae TaxID=126728 RepID=A0ABV2AVS8_9EUKA
MRDTPKWCDLLNPCDDHVTPYTCEPPKTSSTLNTHATAYTNATSITCAIPINYDSLHPYD